MKTITLTDEQVEAIGYALDLAHDDQDDYLNYNNMYQDYGNGVAEAAEHKATRFRHLATIGELLEINGEKERWEALAEKVEEIGGSDDDDE